MALAPNSAVAAYLTTQSGFPRISLPDGRKLNDPHPEWLIHQLRWRFLLDSYEGGEAYRMAVYGYDLLGMPVRNLIRHKREYPSALDNGTFAERTGRPVGTDPAIQSTDDDYELRRARTPVPMFVQEAVNAHLSKIYNREIKRPEDANPQSLVDWWKDVDGRGTSIDQFMQDTCAPLLSVYGQIDLLFDHPQAPQGVEIKTRADEMRHGINTCVVSYILPENIAWWQVDRRGRYTELLMREIADSGRVKWRYWNADGWCLYDDQGQPALADTILSGELATNNGMAPSGTKDSKNPTLTPHPFGVVPIVRIFDRKRPRYKHIGLPRYEPIAELQREYYNRDSELILSDTTQAHPLLQGPEDFVQPDGTIPIGPNWLLPKKKNTQGGSASYEGFEVIQFPKDGADSLRTNKADLRDSADRIAGMTKPAGAAGTTGTTVAQSGISKRLDSDAGNELLGKIAASLQRCEETMAEFVLIVLTNGKPSPADLDAVKVLYPKEFDLFSAEELATAVQQFQLILAQAGAAPETEGEMLKRLVRLMLPGLDDDEYAEMDEEIEARLEAKAADHEAEREAAAVHRDVGAGEAQAYADNGFQPVGSESESSTED